MIMRYCALHTQSLQDAQDIYQEVFLKLFSKQPHFKDEEHAKAWLLKVSINLCKNEQRFKRRHIWIEYDDCIYVPYQKEEPSILQDLRKLPSKYKSVLYLHYFEGYTYKEIALLLKKNENTVRTWVMRAKKQLEEIIKEG